MTKNGMKKVVWIEGTGFIDHPWLISSPLTLFVKPKILLSLNILWVQCFVND